MEAERRAADRRQAPERRQTGERRSNWRRALHAMGGRTADTLALQGFVDVVRDVLRLEDDDPQGQLELIEHALLQLDELRLRAHL